MEMTRISGNAVFADGVRGATIDIENSTISAIRDADLGDTSTELIFPGFVDIHVHAREYPSPQGHDDAARERWEAACRKETFVTAGRAALRGGVTLFAAMPNDPVPPADARSYELKKALASTSPCPSIMFAAVTGTSEPWANLPYKVYLDAHPSPVSFTSWSELENALSRYKGYKLFFHAEDPDILKQADSSGPRWKTRPPEAEIRAIERILDLTAKLGLQSHICHISTEQSAALIAQYNRSGSTPVTCEVTPHHLFFSVDQGEIKAAGDGDIVARHLLECNPPLRSERDRRFLVEALRQGLVDVLATDHAPHTLDDKAKGSPGMPHLDTVGPFACWLMRECDFSSVRIAQILARTPSEIMAPFLERPQGAIAVGKRASFTVLNTSKSTLVKGTRINGLRPLETRCSWSPFDGLPLPGSVTRTVVMGRETLL